MPASARITAPNPSIFTSDPLEQIYARDMFAPGNKGGLAYMFLNAAENARDRNQQQYTGAVDRSNAGAMLLGKLEEEFKHKQEMSKLASNMAIHGFLPSTLSGGSDLFSGNAAAGDPVAQLQQDLVRAKIAHENAAGAAAGRSGGDMFTQQEQILPGIGEGMVTITGKGRNLDTMRAGADALAAKAKERLKQGKVLTQAEIQLLRESQARQSYPGISE